MSKPHKVLELLSGSELEELEAFAREPGRAVDEVHEWLMSRGFTLSRSAAGRWMQSFQERVLAERISGAGGLAQAFVAAARESGGLAIPDAAVLQVAQLVFEAAAKGATDSGDLAKLALALQRLTLAKARVEDVRSEFQKRQAEAVDQAAKAAAGGASGGDVVATIKRALGITRESA